MDLLKVTPEQLISTSDEFNSCGAQIRTLTSNMTSLVDGLKGAWEGEAATAFNTKFHQLDDDMQKMYRMIDEHVKDLQAMAQEYMKAETAAQDMANSLAGDVIS